MGNLCISYDYYYRLEKEGGTHKKCYKCKDKFRIDKGGFSKRRSCRQHMIINNYCTDCNISRSAIVSCNIATCYHVVAPKEKSCIIC